MGLQEPERVTRTQEAEGAKAKRKIMKPLLERRRRERMNQSLSRLRSRLLPAQRAAERRVEKAEILEHTVLFLKSGAPQGPAQLPVPFQDGFSACLDRATHFLRAEGKAPWLVPSLDAALSSLVQDHGSVSERLKKSHKAMLRELVQKRALNSAQPRAQSAHTERAKRPSEGPHRGHQSPGPESLWRPWP